VTPPPSRHIALLLPELEAGGAQRVMLLLAREFAARGHRVDLVLLHASGALLADVPADVRVVDLAARPLGLGQFGFSLSSVRRLAAWLRRTRPDAMLSTITGANLVAVLARRLARIPMRLAIREAVTLDNVTSPLRRRAMRWLYPQADAAIALSPVMADQLVRQLGVPPHRVRCIPNPVDALCVRERGRAPLAHPWLNDIQLKVVISAGRLIPQKDYPTLLRAFALLPEPSSARLIIVGEGPERPRLEALAAELGIADRIHLPGFDANPWRWMARADLFVLSSRWEGHPNALLEALALGLPAVITEYDASAADLAAHFKLRSVPPVTPPALSRALFDMLSAQHSGDGAACGNARETVERYLAELR
jgi:glycosyltransferase involved in cell wall biosynthesis